MQLINNLSPNHDILRQRAKELVFPLSVEVKHFIKEFWAFFNTLRSGNNKPPAGLAAPQVGYSSRIFIAQVLPEFEKIRRDVYGAFPATLFINPTYTPVKAEGKTTDWEGCFSVFDKMGEVPRYNYLHYEAYTVTGEKISGTAKGLLARIIQHEAGHLNGELFIDHVCNGCRLGPIDEMMAIRISEMQK